MSRLDEMAEIHACHLDGADCVAVCFKAGYQAAVKDAQVLVDAVNVLLPIVKEVFWDHHTAGCLPGSGYHRRADRMVSKKWGWRESKPFTDFEDKVIEALAAWQEMQK